MTDLLDRTKQEIGDRLDELKPLVEEYKQLESAAAALKNVVGSTPTTSAPSPRTKRGPSRAGAKVGGRRRKRVRLSANQRAIRAALGHGPHTVRELVVVTALSDQTLRNNLKGLVGLEMVTKTERGGKGAYALV